MVFFLFSCSEMHSLIFKYSSKSQNNFNLAINPVVHCQIWVTDNLFRNFANISMIILACLFLYNTVFGVLELKLFQLYDMNWSIYTLSWASLVAQQQRLCLQCRCEYHPWVGEIPWRREWQPTLVFLPGDPMDRGAWRTTVHRVGHKEVDKLKRLSTHTRKLFLSSLA